MKDQAGYTDDNRTCFGGLNDEIKFEKMLYLFGG